MFILLILAGLDLEFVIHYYFGITGVYTQFYYLIIVIAGLWYGKKLFGSRCSSGAFTQRSRFLYYRISLRMPLRDA